MRASISYDAIGKLQTQRFNVRHELHAECVGVCVPMPTTHVSRYKLCLDYKCWMVKRCRLAQTFACIYVCAYIRVQMYVCIYRYALSVSEAIITITNTYLPQSFVIPIPHTRWRLTLSVTPPATTVCSESTTTWLACSFNLKKSGVVTKAPLNCDRLPLQPRNRPVLGVGAREWSGRYLGDSVGGNNKHQNGREWGSSSEVSG